MADSHKHAALTAEIANLRERQLEDLGNAIYLGWPSDVVAAHEKREHHITELRRQLESLEG
ncbi:MAG: hypothetical protein WAN70_01200 [Terriglobales bacterium]